MVIWDRSGGAEGLDWIEALRELGLTCQPEKPGQDRHQVITDAPPDEVGLSYYDYVFIRDYPRCRLFVGRGDGSLRMLAIIAHLTNSWFESEHGESVTSAAFEPWWRYTFRSTEASLSAALQQLADTRPDLETLLTTFALDAPPQSIAELQEGLSDIELDDDLEDVATTWLVRLFADAGWTIPS